jgi:hypothetical protein
MTLRDHVIAAALALGVMAASLLIGRSPEVAVPTYDDTPAAVAVAGEAD